MYRIISTLYPIDAGEAIPSFLIGLTLGFTPCLPNSLEWFSQMTTRHDETQTRCRSPGDPPEAPAAWVGGSPVSCAQSRT